MTELQNLVWTEKYRPNNFEDLILENKKLIQDYLKNPKSIPSFIFYSNNPGTGKTTTAKVIIKELNADYLIINSSDERGIDTIRDKIKRFASSLSSNESVKRCIFLDEADGMTRQAQDSLRNLMETFSDNAFFILSCNDLSKVIEPIRSRCISINFEKPDKADIIVRLSEIAALEEVNTEDENIRELTNYYYPDIRTMVTCLQRAKVENKPILFNVVEFKDFLEALKNKDIKYVYEKVYSGTFEIMNFNKWLFKRVYDFYDKLGLEKTSKITQALADTEKHWNLGANLEIIFLSNILEVMRVL